MGKVHSLVEMKEKVSPFSIFCYPVKYRRRPRLLAMDRECYLDRLVTRASLRASMGTGT